MTANNKNHSFNRIKVSDDQDAINKWLEDNKVKQLDCSDNTGLIYQFYTPQFRKQKIAESRHKARKKNKS